MMLVITEALPNDYISIQEIAHQTWPVCYGRILSKLQLDYMLEKFYTIEALIENVQNGQVFLLIKHDTVPIGFAAYEHHYKSKNVTRPHKLYVLPESQRKGIGLTLLQKIEILAVENGSKALSLNVNKFNPAKLFYEKIGFQTIGSEDIEIGNGFLMEDFIMEKRI